MTTNADNLAQRLNATRFHDALVMVEARAEIERLRACLRYEEHRFAAIGTHSEGCYAWGPKHYECALREIERLRAEVDRYKVAWSEYNDRTEWVQQTAKPKELGMHRADVLRMRVETAERELAELRERFDRGIVADISDDGKHNGESSLLSAAIKAGYYQGKRVRLVVED